MHEDRSLAANVLFEIAMKILMRFHREQSGGNWTVDCIRNSVTTWGKAEKQLCRGRSALFRANLKLLRGALYLCAFAVVFNSWFWNPQEEWLLSFKISDRSRSTPSICYHHAPQTVPEITEGDFHRLHKQLSWSALNAGGIFFLALAPIRGLKQSLLLKRGRSFLVDQLSNEHQVVCLAKIPFPECIDILLPDDWRDRNAKTTDEHVCPALLALHHRIPVLSILILSLLWSRNTNGCRKVKWRKIRYDVPYILLENPVPVRRTRIQPFEPCLAFFISL